MQTKKTLSNSENQTRFDIECKLVPRLKFMGYIFTFLCLASLIFAFFVHSENKSIPPPLIIDENSILADIEALSGTILFTDMQPLEIAPQDVLNFYAVSLIFGSIGTSLFFHYSKKNKIIQNQIKEKEDFPI
jgi:hypothetical protein